MDFFFSSDIFWWKGEVSKLTNSAMQLMQILCNSYLAEKLASFEKWDLFRLNSFNYGV